MLFPFPTKQRFESIPLDAQTFADTLHEMPDLWSDLLRTSGLNKQHIKVLLDFQTEFPPHGIFSRNARNHTSEEK